MPHPFSASGTSSLLNPRPGASLGEAIGRNLQQIVPDFIVETYDDGTINISLNNRNVPELRMSRDFTEMHLSKSSVSTVIRLLPRRKDVVSQW